MATSAQSACANEGPERRSPCEKEGTLECANCHLVTVRLGVFPFKGKHGSTSSLSYDCMLTSLSPHQYCSKECQVSHWPVHKDCKSELSKSSWRPSWDREGRTPTFVGNNHPPFIPFGRAKFLLGNVPALDIINLEANEGKAYNKHMNLLFAGKQDFASTVCESI